MPEFCEVGAAHEEIFQESPNQEETSAAKEDEEYNSPTNKGTFSDFEVDDTYLTELTGEPKQSNHGKVKQASKKRNLFTSNH